ncbi:MAG: MMPL family transporter [Gammaproteobacteria bacterium]|nr:MMPL family transporter [Gammaproteobacteria bacterium]
MLGKSIYQLRYFVIVMWILAIIFCLPKLSDLISPFSSSGFENINSQSYALDKTLQKNIGYQKNRLLILFKNVKDLPANRFHADVTQAIKSLKHISYPYELSSIIKDDAYLVVLAFKNSVKLSADDIQSLKELFPPNKNYNVYFGGEEFFIDSVNTQTQQDLYHADMIAAPVSAITLFLVFGSLVAAIMPLILGASCAVLVLFSVYTLAHFMDLSIFTINIALLLGLCLSLDYALFIICRFREELSENYSIEEAIAHAMATAGNAVFYSGLAVFFSLCALLMFPINILISVGVGGLFAVLFSVLAALTLLPAILSIIGAGIDKGALFKTNMKESHFWHSLASKVVSKPYLCLTLGFLLISCLCLPFKNLVLGISDYHILPEKSQTRAFFDEYTKSFAEESLSPITLALSSKQDMFSDEMLERTHAIAHLLEKRQDVQNVTSYVSWMKDAPWQQYQHIYKTPRNMLPKQIQNILKTTTSPHQVVFYIESKYPLNHHNTQMLVRDLRKMKFKHLQLGVTGSPANNVDVFDGIKRVMPKAIYLILCISFLVLMVLLKSIFLPFKAIVMNILSLSATYGVLVFIFQQGHFHELLHFEPQHSLDISMMVIIFCALFGFSMDYEVFLLSRIQEAYQQHQHNRMSIVYGIEHSSRIITSAALIVMVLCGSFLVADVLMVKAFGLGIAVAIFIDAFLIRTFMVPAIMTLTKKINWVYPKYIAAIFSKHHH